MCRLPSTVAAQATGKFFAMHAFGSFLFDSVHYAAHSLSRRSYLARWHNHHHKFQDTRRTIHSRPLALAVVYVAAGCRWVWFVCLWEKRGVIMSHPGLQL